MATGIPYKRRRRFKVDDYRINEVAVKAAAVMLPWDDVSPVYFSDWLDMCSKALGATKELMFMSILPAVSSLLGLSNLQLTPTHGESLGLFMLAICPSSDEKTQCFSFGCRKPISFVERESDKCLLLEKFTQVGLQQHLFENNGVGLLMKGEMEDTLRDIHSEEECGTLCELFDGDSLHINGGRSNFKQEVRRSSLAIGGFIQVKEFFGEIYPMMVTCRSGFDSKFLIAVLQPRVFTRRETQPSAEQLSQSNIPKLHDVYKAIYDDHKHGDIVYTLNMEARELYDQFDVEICQKINHELQSGQLVHTTTGKERYLVLRLAVTLFVLYSYTRRPLFQMCGPVERVISEACMRYAIKLISFFQKQREEIDKILSNEKIEPKDSLPEKIVSFPGPVCLIKNLRAAASSNLCRDWTAEVVKGAMVHLSQRGLGETVTANETMAFIKHPPDTIDETALVQETGLSKVQYQEFYLRADLNLSRANRDELISRANMARQVQDYLEQNH